MPFILTGFRQIAGVRVFAFERNGKDVTPAKITVSADINLGRRHGIQLQDWPRLCVEMLELPDDEVKPETYDVIFDEARMREIEDSRAAIRLAGLAKRSRMSRPVGKPLPAFAAGA